VSGDHSLEAIDVGNAFPGDINPGDIKEGLCILPGRYSRLRSIRRRNYPGRDIGDSRILSSTVPGAKVLDRPGRRKDLEGSGKLFHGKGRSRISSERSILGVLEIVLVPGRSSIGVRGLVVIVIDRSRISGNTIVVVIAIVLVIRTAGTDQTEDKKRECVIHALIRTRAAILLALIHQRFVCPWL